jgi:hypothetical protein
VCRELWVDAFASPIRAFWRPVSWSKSDFHAIFMSTTTNKKESRTALFASSSLWYNNIRRLHFVFVSRGDIPTTVSLNTISKDEIFRIIRKIFLCKAMSLLVWPAKYFKSPVQFFIGSYDVSLYVIYLRFYEQNQVFLSFFTEATESA